MASSKHNVMLLGYMMADWVFWGKRKKIDKFKVLPFILNHPSNNKIITSKILLTLLMKLGDTCDTRASPKNNVTILHW